MFWRPLPPSVAQTTNPDPETNIGLRDGSAISTIPHMGIGRIAPTNKFSLKLPFVELHWTWQNFVYFTNSKRLSRKGAESWLGSTLHILFSPYYGYWLLSLIFLI